MKIVKDYLLITIGIILVAIGLEYFFFPNEIASGGVSGLALILYDLIGVKPGIVMIISNIILFIIAFIFLGGSFGVKSIYASFGLSFIMSIIEKLFNPVGITNNLILATIFGSVILGMGVAIVFSQGASTGGTNIIAAMLSKYGNMDIGKGILISDSLVIILALYTFGAELGMFGLLSVYLTSIIIDKFIDGFNSCKQVMIFTDREELVVNYIMKDVDRGCTVFKGKGGFTREENIVIFTVLDRRQFIKLKKFMKQYNPEAFITVNEATEVLGKGFRNLLD
ncbi:MAG: YitT family protein [Clostridiales bacterium]|nr:YitT family protein [Clostridiales bacterium]